MLTLIYNVIVTEKNLIIQKMVWDDLDNISTNLVQYVQFSKKIRTAGIRNE